MASNFSQRKRLAEVMAQPLGHYYGWVLQVACSACRDKRTLPIERLLATYAGHHPMRSVINRLRCSLPSCRRAPSFVKLVRPSDGRSGRPALLHAEQQWRSLPVLQSAFRYENTTVPRMILKLPNSANGCATSCTLTPES